MHIIKEDFFSLFNDICGILMGREIRKLSIQNRLFHFYFLNMDISVTIHIIHLKFSVCILKIRLEGSISNISIWALVFILWKKMGSFNRHKKKKLRHTSLHLYLINTCLKFQSFTLNSLSEKSMFIKYL